MEEVKLGGDNCSSRREQKDTGMNETQGGINRGDAYFTSSICVVV